MKAVILVLCLFFSCQKTEKKIQSNETLDFYNFTHESEVGFDQIETLYNSNDFYDKSNFEITDGSRFNLMNEVTGDLFESIFYNAFVRIVDEDGLGWGDFKENSRLFYLGKIEEFQEFKSQVFLMSVADKDNLFLLKRLVMINSKNNILLSYAVLAEKFCDEECIGKKTSKLKDDVYSIETITNYSKVFRGSEEDEDYFTLFKIDKNGFVKLIQN